MSKYVIYVKPTLETEGKRRGLWTATYRCNELFLAKTVTYYPSKEAALVYAGTWIHWETSKRKLDPEEIAIKVVDAFPGPAN